MLVRRKLAVAGHRREADPVLLCRVVKLPGIPLADEFLHELVHQILVLGSARPIGEHLEFRPFRAAHELDEALPLILLDADEEDRRVLRLEDAPRDQPARVVARQHRIVVGVARNAVFEDRRNVVLLGEVDVIPDPGPIRFPRHRQDGGGAGGAGHQRTLVAEHLERRQARFDTDPGAEVGPTPGVTDDQLRA